MTEDFKKLKAKLYWKFRTTVGSSRILSKLFFERFVKKELSKTGESVNYVRSLDVLDWVLHRQNTVLIARNTQHEIYKENGEPYRYTGIVDFNSKLYLRDDTKFPYFICVEASNSYRWSSGFVVIFFTPERMLEITSDSHLPRNFYGVDFIPILPAHVRKLTEEWVERKKNSETASFKDIDIVGF